VEEHLVIRRNHQGGTDGRNSLRRIRESREPLDLTEEQGRYGEYSKRFKAQEGQDRRSEPQGTVGFTRGIPYRGFVG
jgi:hypothetical protein